MLRYALASVAVVLIVLGATWLEGSVFAVDQPTSSDLVSTSRVRQAPLSWPGWWSGDTHIHSNGCGGNRSPDQMLALMNEAGVNVGAALVWGLGYDVDRPYFTGADWPSSMPNRLLHYDLEVSGFPSDLMGHLIGLRLQNIDFPRRLFTLPIAQWARAQGAVTGFAHATAWPGPYTFPAAGLGSVPYELPIDLALGQVDFLETEFLVASETGTPADSFYFLWTSLLNSGFRLAITGASDFPCASQPVGAVRTWAYVEGPLMYASWVEAIRQGRTVVAVGANDFLTMTVNGAPIGGEVTVPAGTATVSVQVDAALSAPGAVEILVNGAVAATRPVGAGAGQSVTVSVPITRSAWVAARASRAQTGATYVLIDGRPIRASARDAQYWVDYIENLIAQINAGAFVRHDVPAEDLAAEMAQAIPLYRQAQAVFAQRAREAQGQSYGSYLPVLMKSGSDTPTATPSPTPTGTPSHHASPTATPTVTSTPSHFTTPTATPTVTPTQGSATAPLYGIFEQGFAWGSAGYDNPWERVQVTMTLTSPTGRPVTVGGFYYITDTWRVRFSPTEIGTWSWQARIGDGSATATSGGSFTVVASDRPGFVRRNPDNVFRWVFDDGSPYYPLGIGDCIFDVDRSGSPLDNWGFDGGFRGPGIPEWGWITDTDTYLGAYSAAGVNLFRWSVDNCAFGLYQTISPDGNVYLMQEGLWGDQLVQGLREHGFRTYMAIFGFFPPFPTGSGNPAQMDAVKRYVKYVVDRYGAYVDFWELMNEYPNPPNTIDDAWYTEVAAYLRSIDPYQHPISTSWQRPDLAAIEITSPHWYQKENELESDLATRDQVDHWKSFAKPVIFGEQGNAEQNWDARSALRMRLRSWTAFFREGVFIFWNSSFARDFNGGVASNIYLGPEERGYLRVLQEFVRDLDRRLAIVSPQTSDPARVRAYALRSPTSYVAYVHAYTDHASPAAGITLTVDLLAGGTARWIDPSTGVALGTQAVGTGAQTLAVPSFTTDVALRITAD